MFSHIIFFTLVSLEDFHVPFMVDLTLARDDRAKSCLFLLSFTLPSHEALIEYYLIYALYRRSSYTKELVESLFLGFIFFLLRWVLRRRSWLAWRRNL